MSMHKYSIIKNTSIIVHTIVEETHTIVVHSIYDNYICKTLNSPVSMNGSLVSMIGSPISMHEWLPGQHEWLPGQNEWLPGQHEWLPGQYEWPPVSMNGPPATDYTVGFCRMDKVLMH